MDRKQADELSRREHPGSRSLRCLWHCGLISGEIRRAAKLGATSVTLSFPPKHYVARHREAFREIFLSQGFDVSFEPNFKYIRPTEWIMTIGWKEDPA